MSSSEVVKLERCTRRQPKEFASGEGWVSTLQHLSRFFEANMLYLFLGLTSVIIQKSFDWIQFTSLAPPVTFHKPTRVHTSYWKH